MNKPRPKTVGDDLVERFERLFDSVGRLGDIPEWEQVSLRRDLDRLAKMDVLRADCFRVSLATLLGDDGAAEERIRNMEQNNHVDEARGERMRFAGNRLRARTVFELARQAVAKPLPKPLHELLPGLITSGAFRPAVELLDAASAENRVTMGTKAIELARAGAQALDDLGIEDEVVAATVEEVGSLLWEHGLIWMGSMADIWASPASAGEPGLLVQYHVPMSPGEAAALSWDLSARLAEKDLLRPGFAVGILGLHLAAAAAA